MFAIVVPTCLPTLYNLARILGGFWIAVRYFYPFTPIPVAMRNQANGVAADPLNSEQECDSIIPLNPVASNVLEQD